jgi:ketosteroid isomerase-like protein
MQPCDELKNIVSQNYRDHASPGGSLEVVRRYYSQQEGVLFVGTDPKEWFKGYDAIYHYVESTMGGGVEIKMDFLEAWCEGAVGWTVDRIILKLRDGTSVPIRHTHIFQKEGETWKIVHTHVSAEIPDEKLIELFKQHG